MGVAYTEIARVLDRARRRQGWIVLATALGHGLAAAILALLAGALALSLGAGGWARPAALAAATLSLLAGAALAAVRLVRSALSPEGAARAVGRSEPVVGEALLSSVELERERPELERTGRYSLTLVDAHIERAAESARGVDLARTLPAQPAKRAGLALAGAAFASLVSLAALGPSLARGYGLLARGEPPGPPRRAEPITGDIQITYRYPAHTGRAEKRLSGTGGEITAPRGTEVLLETRSDRPVAEAEIVVEGESVHAERRPLSERPESRHARGESEAEGPSTSALRAYARGERKDQPSARSGQGEGEREEGPSTPAMSSVRPEPLDRLGAGEVEGRGGERREGVYALQVANRRDLSGRFTVDDGGSYRFRFTKGGKPVAEGPPIPIAVEPDAYPEVRIVTPAMEVEVDARARVRVEWAASDDYGLEELSLVVKPPAGEERRAPLRRFTGVRRESGAFDLDLGRERLAEGEKLLYWLEVTDNDAVSGPKRAASTTHAVKIYSEAEHRRAVLAQAQALWEELVRLLGDRLEQIPRGLRPSPERLAVGEALDGRTRKLHEKLRQAAAEIRREKAAPPEISQALANVAGAIRLVEVRLTGARQSLSRVMRMGRADDLGLGRQVEGLDREMDRELEKDVLYLEELFDKRKAEDLLRLARDLSARRRDLAALIEKYRSAPSEQGKKELLAEIARLRQRMSDLLGRMSELAKGISDEHLNAEALAEMSKARDLSGGLDRMEQKLARGDLEGALAELDAMGSAMQEMLSSLQHAAGAPDEKSAALMKEMLEFKRQLESLSAEQEQLAGETERMKGEYRRRISQRMGKAEEAASRLEALARKARQEVQAAEKGSPRRSEDDLAQARDRLQDLERALAMRDLDAALETVRRALPPMQRLATSLEDEATMSERYRAMTRLDPSEIRKAADHARAALPPARRVREELERIFPDPRGVFGKGEQQRLERMARRQADLEKEAGAMQRRLDQLMREAPVFPPTAGQTVGESRGHMLQAAEELARRDAQRGHGQQRLALDALGRLRKGLEEMAKRAGGGAGGGFPFPFAEAGSSSMEEGSMGDPSQEKVEIPGAEAYKVPEEFRKDLLEAMKQGSPEPYRGEVQRYYEELVK